MRKRRSDSDLVSSAVEQAVLEWEDDPWDGAARSWLAMFGLVVVVVVVAGLIATLFAP